MLDQIKEAKANSYGLVFKDYMKPNISWDDVLLFVYKESVKDNLNLLQKVQRVANPASIDCIGNVQIQNKFWLAPQSRNIFEDFNGVGELLYKLNDSADTRHCGYYQDDAHSCDSPWHFQGIRISLSNRIVSDHHDPHDIFYWQILGTSYWKVDKDITYKLEPGDLFYLPKENSHEVWCDGPRAGLLIDNLI